MDARPLHTRRRQQDDLAPEHHNGKHFKNIWGEDMDDNKIEFAKKAMNFVFNQSLFQRAGLPSKEELKQLFPLAPRDLATIRAPPKDSVTLTWIGHASFLIQMQGANILCDPVFSSRVEPLPYTGPWRYAPLPYEAEELPKIDAVLISHSHYDHLDLGTVRRLGNGPTWFVGLGTGAWFRQEGITNVVECDWWDEREDAAGIAGLKIVCTPCKHWGARTPWDRNTMLWCSWCVKGADGTSFFFAGDTALCPAFGEIGRKHGPFMCAAIPIGAYLPRKFFMTHHASPEDAVQIHLDLKAEFSVGCHWGTFRQKCLEHVTDPPKKLAEEIERRNIPADTFVVFKHGETRVVRPK